MDHRGARRVARWEIERPEVEAEAEELAEQMGIEGAYSPTGATEGAR